MAHYGTLGSHRFSEDVDDIRGANVYGSDGEKLGKIDDERRFRPTARTALPLRKQGVTSHRLGACSCCS